MGKIFGLSLLFPAQSLENSDVTMYCVKIYHNTIMQQFNAYKLIFSVIDIQNGICGFICVFFFFFFE